MAVRYMNKSVECYIHVNANATIVAVGNGTVSNLAITASEEVYTYKIDSIEYGIGGSTTGHVVITTGNSTANSIEAVLVGSDKAENRKVVASNGTNIYVTFVGSANGYVILGIKKNC